MNNYQRYLSNEVPSTRFDVNKYGNQEGIQLVVFNANILDSYSIKDLAKRHLHQNEIAAFNKRVQVSAKREFIASRLIIKWLVSKVLAVDIHRIYLRFSINNQCLQVIRDNEALPLTLSLSHSKGYVLIALSQSKIKLGVDIEKIKMTREYSKLASECFHLTEFNCINQHGLSAFYRFWTLKEALTKAKKLDLTEVLALPVVEQIQPLISISGQYDNCDFSIAYEPIRESILLQVMSAENFDTMQSTWSNNKPCKL